MIEAWQSQKRSYIKYSLTLVYIACKRFFHQYLTEFFYLKNYTKKKTSIHLPRYAPEDHSQANKSISEDGQNF